MCIFRFSRISYKGKNIEICFDHYLSKGRNQYSFLFCFLLVIVVISDSVEQMFFDQMCFPCLEAISQLKT